MSPRLQGGGHRDRQTTKRAEETIHCWLEGDHMIDLTNQSSLQTMNGSFRPGYDNATQPCFQNRPMATRSIAAKNTAVGYNKTIDR